MIWKPLEHIYIYIYIYIYFVLAVKGYFFKLSWAENFYWADDN